MKFSRWFHIGDLGDFVHVSEPGWTIHRQAAEVKSQNRGIESKDGACNPEGIE
jgi:hypothetical protein